MVQVYLMTEQIRDQTGTKKPAGNVIAGKSLQIME